MHSYCFRAIFKIYNSSQTWLRWEKSGFPHQRCDNLLRWHLSRLHRGKPMRNCKHLTSIWRTAALSHIGKGDLWVLCSLLPPGTLTTECHSDPKCLWVGGNTDHTYWYWFPASTLLCTLQSLPHRILRPLFWRWKSQGLERLPMLLRVIQIMKGRVQLFIYMTWDPGLPPLCYPAHLRIAAFHYEGRLVASWVLLEPSINLAAVLQIRENSSAFSQLWRIYQATLGNLPDNTSPFLCNYFLFLGSVP